MSPSSQENTPIYFLKTKSTPNDGYLEQFSPSNGYNPRFIPVFEHKFNRNNLQRVRDLVLSGELVKRYGGIIFTSQRAVEGFSRMIQDEVGKTHTIDLSRSLSLYSVGPATHRSLKSLCDSHFPHAQVVGEDAGTGEKLAGLILSHYNSLTSQNLKEIPLQRTKQDDKLPLLFLVGEQHRDIIPKTLMAPSLSEDQRIEVEKLVVYETVVMESFERDFAAVLEEEERQLAPGSQEDGDNDLKPPKCYKPLVWVVVFSPSGCGVMLRHLGLLGDHEQGSQNLCSSPDGEYPLAKRKMSNKWANFDCRIATIGPTTRDHLISNFGVQPDVCAEVPSPKGLAESIQPVIVEWKKAHQDI